MLGLQAESMPPVKRRADATSRLTQVDETQPTGAKHVYEAALQLATRGAPTPW
jgi:hypothetical protein